MGRTVDDVALLLSVLGAPDGRDPMHRPIDLPVRARPPDRPLRVAWSRDIGGAASKPTQVDVLDAARAGDGRPRLGRRRRRARAGAGADDCFRALRAWNIANGPTAPFHDRMDDDQGDDPGRDPSRQRRSTAADVATAYGQLGALWRRDVDVLRPRLRPARLPGHPGRRRSRSRWSTRRRSPASPLTNYIDWMAACWRITVTGVPGAVAAGRVRRRRPAGRRPARHPPGRRRRPARAPRRRWRRRPGHAARRPPLVASPMTAALPRPGGRRHGGRLAIVDPAGSWTFATIDDDAVHLAGGACARRRHGDRVAILVHGRPRLRHRRPGLLARRRHRRAAAPAAPRRRAAPTCSPTAGRRRSSPRRRTARRQRALSPTAAAIRVVDVDRRAGSSTASRRAPTGRR